MAYDSQDKLAVYRMHDGVCKTVLDTLIIYLTSSKVVLVVICSLVMLEVMGHTMTSGQLMYAHVAACTPQYTSLKSLHDSRLECRAMCVADLAHCHTAQAAPQLVVSLAQGKLKGVCFLMESLHAVITQMSELLSLQELIQMRWQVGLSGKGYVCECHRGVRVYDQNDIHAATSNARF